MKKTNLIFMVLALCFIVPNILALSFPILGIYDTNLYNDRTWWIDESEGSFIDNSGTLKLNVSGGKLDNTYVRRDGSEMNGTFNLNDGILRIQDEASLVVYDTDGEAHLVDADLERFDELRANCFTIPLDITTISNSSGDYVNISGTGGQRISFVISSGTTATSERFNYSSIVLKLNSGTNTTPALNRIYVQIPGGVPTWYVSTSEPVGQHAMAARINVGSQGYIYSAAMQEDGTNGVLKRTQRRFRKEGLLYESGFNYSASDTNILIDEGQFITGVFDLTTENIIDSDNGLYTILLNGDYEQYTDYADLMNTGEYSDGNSFGSNKYVNVILGLIPYNGDGRIYSVVQSKPPTEYTSVISAYSDSDNTLNIYPTQDFERINFLPIARIIMNTNSGEAKLLPNGYYAEDYRGGVAGGVTSGGGLAEADPLSIHKDGSVAFTGNWDAGNYDVTFDTDTLIIDSSNNRVGVGDTSPDTKLDVEGALAGTQDIIRGTGNFWMGGELTYDNTYSVLDLQVPAEDDTDNKYNKLTFGTSLGDSASISALILDDVARDADLLFHTSSGGNPTEKMRITEDGKLGIGIDTPSSTLHVNDHISNEIRVSQQNNTEWSMFGMGTDNNARSAYILNYGSNHSSQANQLSFKNLYGNMTWFTGTAGVPAQKMILTTDGNVGIGTTTPDEELEIESTTPNLRLTDSDGGYGNIRFNSGNLLIEADDASTVASSNMIFQVDNTERMRIDTSGNVGIGTASPLTLLNMESTDPDLLFTDTGEVAGDKNFRVQYRSSSLFFDSRNDANSAMDVANILVLERDGNVGIGTSTPSSKLSIVGGSLGDSTSGNAMHFATVDTGRLLSGGGTDKVATIHTYYDSTAVEISAGVSSTYKTGITMGSRSFTGTGTEDINFWTRGTQKVTIDGATGNVGIGETSPDARLHVNSAGTNVVAKFESTDANAGIQLTDSTGTVSIYNVAGEIGFYPDAGTTEAMRIDSSGNVGIGTNNPSRLLHTYKSAVTGSYLDTYAEQLFDSAESRIQLRSDNSGHGSGIILSAGAESWSVWEEDNGDNFAIGKRVSAANEDIISLTTPMFSIDSSGNVGVGTEDAVYNVQIGDGTSASETLALTSSTSGISYLYLGDSADADRGAIYYSNNLDAMYFRTSAASQAVLTSSIFQIFNGKLYVGDNSAAGSDPLCWDGSGGSNHGDCSSDGRYKPEELRYSINMSEETYNKITPFKYTWDEEHGNFTEYGFIAQNLYAADPLLAGVTLEYNNETNVTEMIPTSPEYWGLIALNTEMIQRLQKENKEFKTRLTALEQAICNIDKTQEVCS